MSPFTRSIVVSALLLATPLAAHAARPAGESLPKDGSTIVFFGDSITQAGLYVEYVDAFLATRFPDRTFHVLNRGITSETISGTSEPDHVPRRPNAHDRFDRDIVSAKPDVLVACFGMNDGNYFPFEPERFARYREGVQHLAVRTHKELRANLVLLTPPPFDAYARKVLDPQAVSFGYKFPAIEYEDTLQRYSSWLITLNRPGVKVVDVHTALKRHLQARRSRRVSFRLQEDGIHPDPTGHWLMAQALLEAWGVPAVVAEAGVDAATMRTLSGEVTHLVKEDRGIAFTWRSPLPMPMAPEWDRESIDLEKTRERFNRHRLSITGLQPGRYGLSADGTAVAEVTEEQLNAGLDLLSSPQFPTTRASLDLLRSIHLRQQLEVSLWRQRIAATAPAGGPNPQLQELDTRIRELTRPREIRIQVRRLDVPAPRQLRVAAVSMESQIRQPDQNLRRIDNWVRQAAAAHAELVLLPEAALSGWWASRQVRAQGESLDGPAIQKLVRLAKELRIVIAFGMTERDADSAFITQVLLDGNGVIGTHRKTELAPGEEKTWDPGHDANVFEVKGIRIGVAICYESVHPSMCARLKANGAELILAPYANGTDPDELLNGRRPYPSERAKENRVWYVACDAPLHDGTGLHRGAAYVISPTGQLAAITGPKAEAENMIVHTIELPANPSK